MKFVYFKFAFNMSTSLHFGLLALVGFIHITRSAGALGKLPPSFEICHIKQPKYELCLQNAVEKAIRTLSKGYPPLGIHSIDPLQIVQLEIDQGSGPIQIKLKFRDLKILGFKESTLSDIEYDVKNYKYSAKALTPKVILKGKYMIDGKMLVLPITGNGTCVLTLDNVMSQISLIGKELKKDGKIFMMTDRFDFKFETTKLTTKFENLFNGDKQLGDNMNVFLNENWKEILAELKPAIQQVFGAAFAEISNRIFTKVPYEDIFPE